MMGMTQEDRIRACFADLLTGNLPLYWEPLRLAVFWSPKAGCTFALRWFLFQAGLLDEALRHGDWLHDYRLEVLFRRAGYLERAPYVLAPGWRRVKFVRDPFDRAVSAYLAYCEAAHMGQRARHDEVLSDIEAHLGRPVGEGATFSFREYVAFLEAQDLDTCNPHLRRQVTCCERDGVLRDLAVIRIEESGQTLPLLESALGLPHADLESARRSAHHTTRDRSGGFVGDGPFLRAIGQPVPPSACFYDASTRMRIEEMYREDFVHYGYPTQINGN